MNGPESGVEIPDDELEDRIERSITVLHVDDEPDFSDVVSDYLERLNEQLTVLTEQDPTAALDRLQSENIDCVVSDYQMPKMDGVELLDSVREEYPNLPFFLFTGKGSETVASDAIESGVTSYLQKGGTETYSQLENRIQNAMERFRSERRARVAQDRLLSLYEQTDGFYILEEDWSISYWNRQMAERTELSPEEVLGKRFWDVFPTATETEVYGHFQTAMEAREPVEFETSYDPLGYWTEVRTYPVDDGLFVHSRKITEKKEREQELKRRNHILQSFASTVSHDLRNPLNVAEGRLQLAKETGDFEHLEEVAQAHNRMRNLIDELLRLARGEALELRAVSLGEMAELAWETIDADGTALVVEDDLSFEAHDSQLRRLFENLFWNALEHGDATTICVGTIDGDGFFVEDDGVGIPASERERVFESGVSTDVDSPGYGLSIVQGIADTHGWEIGLGESSESGARFEITF
jgi:PAS domain S-box-containing protein